MANVIWQKKQSPQNDATYFSDMHDFVVVYAKKAKVNKNDSQGWQRLLMKRTEDQKDRYSNPDSVRLRPAVSAAGPGTASPNATPKTRPAVLECEGACGPCSTLGSGNSTSASTRGAIRSRRLIQARSHGGYSTVFQRRVSRAAGPVRNSRSSAVPAASEGARKRQECGTAPSSIEPSACDWRSSQLSCRKTARQTKRA